MRGINKRIIEITDTENEAIEKIFIVIKPGAKHVHLAQQKAEAEKYSSAIVSYRRFPFFKNLRPGLISLVIGITAVTAAVLIIL